jgi:hypothetical protein
MANVQSAFKADPHNGGYLHPHLQRHFQRVFEAQAARSYLYLSLGIGLIPTFLPLLLVWRGGYSIHDSISSYYTSDVGSSRDIMVGLLCAVGVFLFLFHGLSKMENWLLNFAGVAVIAVAFVPMTTSELLHRGFAILFFLLIGIVAICFSKGRVKCIPHERSKRFFIRAYTAAGTAMIVLPLSIAVLQFTPFGRFEHYMFWIESAAIWAFAIYWFLKTAEYRLLLRIRWFAPSEI